MSLSLIHAKPYAPTIPKPHTIDAQQPTPRHKSQTAMTEPIPRITAMAAPAITHTAASASQLLDQALLGSLAPSMCRKYVYALQNFTRFCKELNLTPLSATENTLCLFTAQGVGRLTRTTARNAISAVRAHHLENGDAWAGGTRLSRVLCGVEQLASVASKKPLQPAPP
jgi:hypothetical protein